jgi:hypothetical protein
VASTIVTRGDKRHRNHRGEQPSLQFLPDGRYFEMWRRFQADEQGDDDFRVCVFGGLTPTMS